MARIRSIKPEIWLSPQVMNLSLPARMLFIGLITQADDDGRGMADPRRIKATVFPADDVTNEQITDWLAECVRQSLIFTYDGGQHGPLYELPKWHAHQKIDRRSASRFPKPNGAAGAPMPQAEPVTPQPISEDSPNARRTFDEPSPKTRRRIKDQGSRIGKDLSVSSYVTAARTRASNEPDIKKNNGRRIEPRAGPGLQLLAPTLETFLVEHTPESQRVYA